MLLGSAGLHGGELVDPWRSARPAPGAGGHLASGASEPVAQGRGGVAGLGLQVLGARSIRSSTRALLSPSMTSLEEGGEGVLRRAPGGSSPTPCEGKCAEADFCTV